MTLVTQILAVALAAAPWLLLGLFAAGLIKAFLPEQLMQRWIGGHGLAAIMRAAVVGVPLPLCSCGAIPAALALHRGGAGRGPTTAFLIGTPGVGVDSLAITYALLGPFMLAGRAAGAVVTAISTGLLVSLTPETERRPSVTAAACSSGCNDSGCSDEASTQDMPLSRAGQLRHGLSYAFGDLLDDIRTWLLIGLLLAGVLLAFVPPQALASHGSGLLPMLLMAVIGIPLYICATAATPIAAGMLMAGVSPGTTLVFLLAGPITSMATLGILRQELGNRALVAYLVGVLATTVLVGLLADTVAGWSGLEVPDQIGTVRELIPQWLEWVALSFLVGIAIRPVRRLLGQYLPA